MDKTTDLDIKRIEAYATMPTQPDAEKMTVFMYEVRAMAQEILRLRGKRLVELSKKMSYFLRHNPGRANLALDDQGYVSVKKLLRALGDKAVRADIDAIITGMDKVRFQFSEDGERIRACQGHSTPDVTIDYVEQTPPDFLYHGTSEKNAGAIADSGSILPMKRQYVHLSADHKTAMDVGKRHGVPTALVIAAGDMWKHGFKFYKADNGVWLVSEIPVKYLVASSHR